MERGAGLPRVSRLAYLAEMAAPQLAGIRHLILAGTPAPVSFFGYPGQASSLVPDGADVHLLAGPGDDVAGALTALADLVAPGTKPAAEAPARPALPGRRAGRGHGRDRASARCCRRGRSSATSRTPRGWGWAAPPPGRRRTTGSR